MLRQWTAMLLISFIALMCAPLYVKGQYYGTYENHTDIEGIRLVSQNGTIGGSRGRVQVLYGGEWREICEFWTNNEAKVVCRMLGFEDALCPADFGWFNTPRPTYWMDGIRCTRGNETYLDQCYFFGWGTAYCIYPAELVCSQNSTSLETHQTGVPYNITLIASSTTSLTVGWKAPISSAGLYVTKYELWCRPDFQVLYLTYPSDSWQTEHEDPEITIGGLKRDTNYRIDIRARLRHRECGNHIFYGAYSDRVYFQTNKTRKQSNITLRLVPSRPDIDFMGRLEVLHDNQWGTICDDNFGVSEANIACHMLNFTGGLCLGNFGQGQGPIWLDNVDCGVGVEALEDCSLSPWGQHDCDNVSDVGVLCEPNGPVDLIPPVEGLTVVGVTASSVTVRWNVYNFPSGINTQGRGFELRFARGQEYTTYRSGVYSRVPIDQPYRHGSLTVNNLPLYKEFNISVRAYVSFPVCSYPWPSVYGAYSNPVLATRSTVETVPWYPSSVRLIAINSSAIEVQWRHPSFGSRGGIIRGYKIFVQLANGRNETVIDTQTNATVYVIGGLMCNTSYAISVLAYTGVGDGPKSKRQTTSTLDYDPIIGQFGPYGNYFNESTRFTGSRYPGGTHIFCGPRDPSQASADWFFMDGTRIGYRSQDFRVDYLSNGTAVLEIAEQRRVRYCDGGTYVCTVNGTNQSESRNFTVKINPYPLPPRRTFLIRTLSTSVTIGWADQLCNGGHKLVGFKIRYFETSEYCYNSVSEGECRHSENIDPNLRAYTITGLRRNMEYGFQVIAVDSYAAKSPPSAKVVTTTLPPAASSPQYLGARVVKPLMVEVKWRTPTVLNGNLSHYNVYAFPGSHRAEPTITMFPGTTNVGNVTLDNVNVTTTFYFRISAVVFVEEGITDEGYLSNVIHPVIIERLEEITTVPTSPDASSSYDFITTTSSHNSSHLTEEAVAGMAVGITVGVAAIILVTVLVILAIRAGKPNFFNKSGQKGTSTKEHKLEPHFKSKTLGYE